MSLNAIILYWTKYNYLLIILVMEFCNVTQINIYDHLNLKCFLPKLEFIEWINYIIMVLFYRPL